MRPNGKNENLYQYQSGGIYHQNQLITNFSIRERKLSLFGFYVLNFAKADTSGVRPTFLPINSIPREDYGRSTFDVHNRFLLGGNYQAPLGISISPFMVLNSGTPFNITVGQDLNGDNQFNDRPAFATSSSTDVINTKYGDFDLNPGADEARIPTTSSTARRHSAEPAGKQIDRHRTSRRGRIRRGIQWASGRRRRRPWIWRWPSRRRTGPGRPQQRWRKASDARSASTQALFVELYRHGQKHLQQREPCAAGRCS